MSNANLSEVTGLPPPHISMAGWFWSEPKNCSNYPFRTAQFSELLHSARIQPRIGEGMRFVLLLTPTQIDYVCRIGESLGNKQRGLHANHFDPVTNGFAVVDTTAE